MKTNLTSALRTGVVAAFILPLVFAGARADGVMRPATLGYPKDFLRHRLTTINVALHGLVAVTTIYEEFVNEWDKPVDGVYSFPLPFDARATDFLFWSNDTLYRAPLKVREQVVNPGTGEGGIDALLNTYLGSNAIRVLVKEIPAGTPQRIQMEYVSVCRFRNGKLEYHFPLETSRFTDNPLDLLTFSAHVEATDSIGAVDVPGWDGGTMARSDAHHVSLQLDRSKAYLTNDLAMTAEMTSTGLSRDLFASMNDSLGGHFALFLKPGTQADSSMVLPKNILFLIDNSSSVAGVTFAQSVQAAVQCLDRLRQGDRFNVIMFNSSPAFWRPGCAGATPQAIDSAKVFLGAASAGGWSDLQDGLAAALSGFPSGSSNNIILLFTDGRSPLYPDAVTNAAGVSIFPIAIGSNPRRAPLEMLAYRNYGFPTFIDNVDGAADEVSYVFEQVASPIWKDVEMEMGSDAFDILPRRMHAVYSGSPFYATGRYHTGGTVSLSLAGTTASGPQFADLQCLFPATQTADSFAEKLWAKEKIDDIERQIDVYGYSDSLKQLDISLSLSYRIRCMYTASIADKSESIMTAGIEAAGVSLQAFVASAGGSGMTLRWSFSGADKIRGVNVYRSRVPGGPYIRLNVEPLTGNTYIDSTEGCAGAWYKLEAVMADGSTILTAPVSASAALLPAQHALYQKYPNPFNPSTTIR